MKLIPGIFIRIIPAVVMVFLCCCEAARSPKVPDWVTSGETAAYPSARYLAGIGSAADSGRPDEDRKAADESARVNLASQIRVKVDSELNTRISERSLYAGSGASVQGIQEVQSLISSRVEIELSGVEFVDRHHDSAKGVYYSLAVLDRYRYAAELERRISGLCEEGAHYYEDAESLAESGELFDAVRSLNLAVDVLADAEAENAILEVLQGSPSRALSDELSLWRVRARKEDLKTRLRYLIKIFEKNPLSDNSAIVEGKLVQRLNELGMKAIHSGDVFSGLSHEDIMNAPAEFLRDRVGDKAYFIVVGEVETAQSSRTKIGRNRFFFYKSRADVKLINVQTGKVIFTVAFDWDELTKAGKSMSQQAATLSLEKAGELVADRLAEKMREYLNAE